MKLADLDLNKTYTYADYLKWTFTERVELIKGKIFQMSPAPSSSHQRLFLHMLLEIGNFLKGRECTVYAAPFDVRLPRKSADDKDIITVLQPDICVICDPTKIEERGCLGAPDIVIEILSPSNNKKELKYKKDIYQESGVKEYWIVEPREKAIQVMTFENGTLLSSTYFFTDEQVTTPILPGFSLDVGKLYDNI